MTESTVIAAPLTPGANVAIAELIRRFDWAATPIGAPATWPSTLTAATSLILRNHAPMALLWGAHGVLIYNDVYCTVAGDRNPALLGSNPALLGSNLAQGLQKGDRQEVRRQAAKATTGRSASERPSQPDRQSAS